LRTALRRAGFTGRVGSQLERRLGRPLNSDLAEAGRLLWFDTVSGLNGDNNCSGCHSPSNGFGDTQSIAIGIDNNGLVGPHRLGPRNQRRTPMAINTAFYPTLMWNSRFFARSDDPFNNRKGFQFPAPEGLSLSYVPHLLTAQAFIPPTERTEVTGFDFQGDNHAIRTEVMRRVSDISGYRQQFGRVFPAVRAGGPITPDMFALATAEFEFTLSFADAPLDRFARGARNAMSESQKRGAVLFFGKAGCVACHAVNGRSNEMFSDFRQHVAGIPQVSPSVGNITFDGPGKNEDFGLEQVTGNSRDRYLFRTSPLRNLALQPTFFHNGAFTRLEDAVRYHLDAVKGAPTYSPRGLAPDLTGPTGPIKPVLARLDRRLRRPTHLNRREFEDLVEFLEVGLLDPRAKPENLRKLIPQSVPSGLSVLTFE
jgi:cytochrome c peroxidase